MMLFLWIFGLFAGLANACALGEVHGGHSKRESVSQSHHLAPSVDAHHHDAPGDDESAPQSRDPACQKFCEEGRSTLSLMLKGFGGVADLMPALLQAPVFAWTSEDVHGLAPSGSHAAVHETGPPISIRLLRLTL